MNRRYHVLVNNAAGSVEETGEQLEQIRSAFADAGVEAMVEAVEPPKIPDRMRALWASRDDATDPIDAIVVAGGDGTISCAAGAAVEHDIVLGVLPLGTFNHFAKDLGVPAGLTEAAEYLAGASTTSVDVAEVDGRVFVNNASIGVYPQMVRQREGIRERRGWGKIRAAPVAIVRTLRRLPVQQLHLTLDDGPPLHRVTPFLFVGNGLYDRPGGQVGQRSSLDDHLLGVYVIATIGRYRLILNAIRARLRGVHAAPDTERHTGERFVLDSAARTIAIALDGEPTELPTPLSFRVRPGALRVLAQPPSDDAHKADDY